MEDIMTTPLVQSEQRPGAARSKPPAMRVFVASSSEQLDVADRVAAALKSSRLKVKVWNRDTFDFSASYMESLEKELERADFAVVILTADDTVGVRRNKVKLPRDNVVFELGLFTGRLGRERCFFVIDGTSKTQVASDLLGVQSVTFYPDVTSVESGRPSLDAQMRELRSQMLKIDVRYKPPKEVRRDQEDLWRFSTRIAGHWWERVRTGDDDTSALSYLTITLDEVTNTPQLHGNAYGRRHKHIAEWDTLGAKVIVEKAEIHYRWEGTPQNQQGQKYGGGGCIVFDENFSTASGHFYDTNLADITEGAETRDKQFALYRCERADEKIMSEPRSPEARQLRRRQMAKLQWS
jgi:predicted nucleotide-binding protein